MGNEIDRCNYDNLVKALELTNNIVSDYKVFPLNEILKDETPDRCLRIFQVKKVSCIKTEDILQKLSTIYHAAMLLGCSAFVIINASRIDEPINLYLGLRGSNKSKGGL